MLYDKKQHEPLAGGPWDERNARYAIADIVDELRGAQPLEPPGIYDGRAGETWALRVLGEDVAVELGEADEPSYVEGELGIALVAGERERATAAARTCIASDANELLYGAAGALVSAVLLGLDDVAREAVERLWSTWAFDSKLRACIWAQELDGRTGRNLGAAHGLAGNAYALLRAGGFQSPTHQRELLDRVVEALDRTAMRQGALANWLPSLDAPANKVRVQWCHGAPGIVAALAGAPKHAELDALLLAAGELTWTAGPLKKGPGLCHGTAGNGYAFLKLHRRTRDTKWLERARRFAMHAITQRTGARGLYEGDIGLALYVKACIDVDDRWPLLDYC
ncbi:MAG: lanthionine synthetase C family protein [Gaiellaceae bacterium]